MNKFNSFTSVLTQGFTDRDARPPSNPINVKKVREIGIYDEGPLQKKLLIVNKEAI
ncbi:hypothetical protein P2R64_00210 [Priestia megaterium]|uniref:hypothetical protein n=1 Tax=Priestia megaterium TaxID=1404 RepID=UPI0021C00CAA|nr:hypothetical protein [Priestia megaterium]MCT9858217.1 hypothetical protein [Priestia megaterium]MDF1958483.1 hypothetical protein [Priestia megaterium]